MTVTVIIDGVECQAPEYCFGKRIYELVGHEPSDFSFFKLEHNGGEPPDRWQLVRLASGDTFKTTWF